MLTAERTQVKGHATIARLEEAYETRAFVLRERRRSHNIGDRLAERDWTSELAGVEQDIAALKIALDVAY